MSVINFDDLSTFEIIKEAREKNNHFAYTYLIEKYKGIVLHIIKTKSLFLSTNGNREDLIQEGLIGLHRAIENYDEELGSFESYAHIVIHGHLITAIKASNRYKHQVLNNSISLDKKIEDNNNLTLLDLIANREDVRYNYNQATPEDILFENESKEYYFNNLYKKLSQMEKEVFELYIDGYSYEEITQKLNINTKRVDNTLQRIKQKLRELLILEEVEENNKKNRRLIM